MATWNPDQYARFAAERAQPAHDLLALVEPVPGGAVVDLGCGTGEITAQLHARTGAATTVGLDSSEQMLAKAQPGPGLRFDLRDIADFASDPAQRDRYDVVFSNAALHWLGDHPTLLSGLARTLRPGGQLAVQMPANGDHPSHALAQAVSEEPEFAAAFSAPPPPAVQGVLPPERYATILWDLGFVDQHVRLQVYGHRLAETAEVVEWTRGTTLLRFEPLLPPDVFDAFVARYRERLLATLGDHRPYFFTFKRVLFHARRPVG